MAKKNTTQVSGSGDSHAISKFRKEVEKRVSNGYSCLGTSIPQVVDIPLSSQEDKRCATASNSGANLGGPLANRTIGMFDSKQSNPTVVDNAGTPGFGYIPWGPKNDLPNQIFSLGANLPYTSAALKFLIDLTVGRGPKLMYKWARYAGGTVSEELIPYEHAGVLIRNRIRELKNKLEEERKQVSESRVEDETDSNSASSGMTISWIDALNSTSSSNEKEGNDEPTEPGTLEYEIKTLQEDYKVWKDTMPEYEQFESDNNLTLHFLECMTDYVHMDIYFPTVLFSIGTSKAWNPKIKYIGRIPAVCARLEEMDENMRINYVYYSEKWRLDATAKLDAKDIVARPAVQNKSMLNGLRSIVEKNQRTRVGSRPKSVVCPVRYPSMQNPYYPRPAWWSIFSSMVYAYASTLVVDKAIARQNSTMWSKIIFIDQQYLEQIFVMQNAETPEEQEKVRNDIYHRVNSLLQQKENNGKTLLMDKYLGPDGKTIQYSIEIVDIPQPASGADTKDELEEISSIIFFAFGVHPALIGAVPGKSGSTGGTYQRELTLIKQNLLDPARSLYLKFLQNIAAFNGWDKHAVWKISDLVLTTLDRSKTGTEETTN